ncbi:SDR family oxidoreductase [uncultured Phenylobacterium sp.]|uniref:SDR family oxidoreductase n=1 Tax=uncultured Phenylobacterium sp. TaxID=349273 RepID=UPI0025EE3997|nr:SDR family oxidoreductase [uncultured Phenylobacterium sp.]
MINLDLSGKRAVVTGASAGIGAAAVRALADQGAHVFFCARNAENVAELAAYKPPGGGGSVSGFAADMGDGAAVEGFLDSVLAEGPIDILVNNVGASPSRNFLYMSDDDWSSLFELNLMSAVRCTRRLLPGMRSQKWGRVVMISSGAALYPGAALIDYAATKAAMVATGKALARKYGADGVLVNSVLPGLIHTSMWERAAGEVAQANKTTSEAVLAANARSVPVGRYGTAEEVAALIVFLCSEAASYINGAAIAVDGGQGGHV